MKKEYLEGGRICTAHGVRGLLKVEHMCDGASVLAKARRVFFLVKGEYVERRVKSASVTGQFVLMGIEGVDSREEAIVLRQKIIYLHRDDVPLSKGAMFIADMIGLDVIHQDTGERLGKISDVSDVAGRRIYTVRANNKDVLLPDVPEFIKEIDEERGMRVRPIPGFFDEAYEV